MVQVLGASSINQSSPAPSIENESGSPVEDENKIKWRPLSFDEIAHDRETPWEVMLALEPFLQWIAREYGASRDYISQELLLKIISTKWPKLIQSSLKIACPDLEFMMLSDTLDTAHLRYPNLKFFAFEITSHCWLMIADTLIPLTTKSSNGREWVEKHTPCLIMLYCPGLPKGFTKEKPLEM